METNIAIMVGDKQRMIEALQAEVNDGERYAQLCIRILIDEWGADPGGIDRQCVIEGACGHLIHCKMHGREVTPPSEYIRANLASYSDYGLKKRGLTRAQYNKHST